RHPDWLTNTYLVIDENSKKAALVDAGAPVESFIKCITERGLSLETIFLTHHHHDHVAGLDEWIRDFDVPIRCSAHDLNSFKGKTASLIDGEQIAVGELCFEAIATPGHTHGHFCFSVSNKVIFTGDLIFRGSVGGTVSPGQGDYKALKSSILTRIMTYPETTLLYPRHMEVTTIESELEHNPFVLYWNGSLSALNTPCSVRSISADILVRAKDYDGGEKLLVSYSKGKLEIVPGSWLNA
ncbi:MAG: MBL fold metallo-hydrolase, partial [Bdellovibrionales bacterium]|nr:MBL fold metallo-hydrolase [Bdellovibrionales bacterium]